MNKPQVVRNCVGQYILFGARQASFPEWERQGWVVCRGLGRARDILSLLPELDERAHQIAQHTAQLLGQTEITTR